jgi:hypothetical protein
MQQFQQQIQRFNSAETQFQADQGAVPANAFAFDLRFEARNESGIGLSQSGVLVARAADQAGGQPIAFECRWKRKIGAHFVEIPGITQTMYNLSADDIGMSIVCVAKALNGVEGTASGEVGPIELDPITWLGLEDLVARGGGSRFPVRHYRDPDDPHPRDAQIHVTQDYVKVVVPGPERGNHEETAAFSADFPKVVLHPVDTQKFRLELGDGQENVYHFAGYSRTARDTFALLVRYFHSRREVTTSDQTALGKHPARYQPLT